MRYRVGYPYDVISFISHAISHYDIIYDRQHIVCDIAMLYRMRYRYDAISYAILHCDILCDINIIVHDIALLVRYRMRYRYDAISYAILHCDILCDIHPVSKHNRKC